MTKMDMGETESTHGSDRNCTQNFGRTEAVSCEYGNERSGYINCRGFLD
jgi:hypothetical protein